ncbi:hypothetical protein [Janthinobacterium sp. MDT1-19]|uniref:hypothetical protein n=1 Tax=Janthinobacterium sp. MDT1-19 TaxID=1259339 RepID=UPI003F25F4E0
MNDPKKLFVDARMTGMCIFCGAKPDTRDHCPSKVLLDEPFPLNLPVVAACEQCNQSFSSDERYLACLVECVICGSADPALVRRDNIRRILSQVPQLAAQIQSSMSLDLLGDKTWSVEMDRVRNVVLKLARGHLDYELSIQEFGEPDVFEIVPFALMDEAQQAFFESPELGVMAVWPELGSRAFMRALPSGARVADGWIEVQDGRYRYLAGQTDGNYVHIVLSEYLACRVVWA